MGLEATVPFAALLALIAIAHQAGDAQVLIQSRWVLILASPKIGIVQAGDIHLHILNNDMRNRKRDPLYYADHLLHIGFDRWGQPLTSFAGSSVEEARRAIPFPPSATPAMIAAIIHLLFDIPTVVDFCRE